MTPEEEQRLQFLLAVDIADAIDPANDEDQSDDAILRLLEREPQMALCMTIGLIRGLMAETERLSPGAGAAMVRQFRMNIAEIPD